MGHVIPETDVNRECHKAPPDLIGYFLEDALPLIQDKGFIAENILVTKPLRATGPLGKARVVRLTLIGKAELQVVVAYEDYGKGGVQYGSQDH